MHAEVGERTLHPGPQVVALEHAAVEGQREAVDDPRERAGDPADGAAVAQPPVVEGAGDVLEPFDRLAGSLQRDEEGGDDRAGRRTGDPREGVAGPGQGRHRAGEADALHAAALEDQVGAQRGGVCHAPDPNDRVTAAAGGGHRAASSDRLGGCDRP